MTSENPAPRVDSEVGRLRTVLLHRPGDELKRLTPRNNDQLLFDGLPWVDRAQDEHDAFADLLRSRGVEVLLLSDVLTEALTVSGAARIQGIAAAVDPRRLGHPLAQELAAHLRTVDPVGDPERRVPGEQEIRERLDDEVAAVVHPPHQRQFTTAERQLVERHPRRQYRSQWCRVQSAQVRRKLLRQR